MSTFFFWPNFMFLNFRIPEDCRGHSRWLLHYGFHWILRQVNPHSHQQHHCVSWNTFCIIIHKTKKKILSDVPSLTLSLLSSGDHKLGHSSCTAMAVLTFLAEDHPRFDMYVVSVFKLLSVHKYKLWFCLWWRTHLSK